MSQDLRLTYVNSWPNITKFPAESAFDQRLTDMGNTQLFVPHQFLETPSREAHITISYLIDALSSLPRRPDHAFDWTWRAFENIVSSSAAGNITNLLRTEATPQISGYLLGHATSRQAFFSLLEQVPFQTCEYLFKQIALGAPYSSLSTAAGSLSKFAKRLLFNNGGGPIVSFPLLYLLSFLSTRYSYNDNAKRRNGAALLRLALKGQRLALEGVDLQLSVSDRVFLLLSGLAYSFRNDRAHANSIAPFQSSLATLRTYAHCWFMFLLTYQCLVCYLRTRPDPPILTGNTDENFRRNNEKYIALFGREIRQ